MSRLIIIKLKISWLFYRTISIMILQLLFIKNERDPCESERRGSKTERKGLKSEHAF